MFGVGDKLPVDVKLCLWYTDDRGIKENPMKETFYRYNVPVKICLLADIHNRPFGEIITSLRRHRPDIIAVAGDIIERVRTDTDKPVIIQPKYSLDFIRACTACAPTFFSLGNHEWMLSDKDKKIIASLGATVLDNSFVHFGKLCIGGLTSSGASAYAQFRKDKPQLYPTWNYFNAPQRYEPQTDWLDEFERQDGFKLLLCHHPEYLTKYLRGRKIDLILSGHAHGGQIRLFGQGLFAPGQGFLPQLTSGRHANMIISRGLANTAKFVPRLFNRREIVYVLPK